jgi:hypothetical protein
MQGIQASAFVTVLLESITAVAAFMKCRRETTTWVKVTRCPTSITQMLQHGLFFPTAASTSFY